MARAIRTPGRGSGEAVLVWDLPLRLFHRILVLLFLAGCHAQLGQEEAMRAATAEVLPP